MNWQKVKQMTEGRYFFCYAGYSMREMWKRMDPRGWELAHARTAETSDVAIMENDASLQHEASTERIIRKVDASQRRGAAIERAADDFAQSLAVTDPKRFESLRKINSLYRAGHCDGGSIISRRLTLDPMYYCDLKKRQRKIAEIERRLDEQERAKGHFEVSGRLHFEELDRYWPIPIFRSVDDETVVSTLQIHSEATPEQVAAFKKKMVRCYRFECRMEQVSPEFAFSTDVVDRINSF